MVRQFYTLLLYVQFDLRIQKNQHKRNKEHKFHTFSLSIGVCRLFFFSYSKSSKSELLILLLDVVDIDDLTLALTDDDDFGDNTMFVLNPGG